MEPEPTEAQYLQKEQALLAELNRRKVLAETLLQSFLVDKAFTSANLNKVREMNTTEFLNLGDKATVVLPENGKVDVVIYGASGVIDRKTVNPGATEAVDVHVGNTGISTQSETAEPLQAFSSRPVILLEEGDGKKDSASVRVRRSSPAAWEEEQQQKQTEAVAQVSEKVTAAIDQSQSVEVDAQAVVAAVAETTELNELSQDHVQAVLTAVTGELLNQAQIPTSEMTEELAVVSEAKTPAELDNTSEVALAASLNQLAGDVLVSVLKQENDVNAEPLAQLLLKASELARKVALTLLEQGQELESVRRLLEAMNNGRDLDEQSSRLLADHLGEAVTRWLNDEEKQLTAVAVTA